MPNFESYPQDPTFRPHSELHDVGRIPTLCLFKIPFDIIYAFFSIKVMNGFPIPSLFLPEFKLLSSSK